MTRLGSVHDGKGSFMPEFAKSADGTVIAFDCVGYGPAFVVCGLLI